MKGYINGIDWLNISPMKYWSFTAATSTDQRKQIVTQAIYSGEYLGALKVDGYYQRLLKDEDGNCFMIARSLNVKGEIVDKIEWVPHINPWFSRLPNGTCVLSECYLPGNEGSNKITSILGCLKEKAIARQEAGQKLNFYIFDIMAFNGNNYNKMGYGERAEALTRMSEVGAYQSQYVQYAKFYEGQELWDRLQAYLAAGREGIVIMRKDAPVYQKRTPARVSIKIKKELKEDIDVIVIGANPPTRLYNGIEIMSWPYWENVKTGEKFNEKLYKEYSEGAPIEPVTKAYFYGWAGSLQIGARKDDKVVKIGSLSGMTEEVLSNWQSYRGKVATITGMQIMYDEDGTPGGIRHPRFSHWRPDLTPKDTDWYRIFGDKK